MVLEKYLKTKHLEHSELQKKDKPKETHVRSHYNQTEDKRQKHLKRNQKKIALYTVEQ